MSALSSGTRVGPYEVLAAIGVGGMGEVYRARDPKLNRDVALKVLPELFAIDPDRLARFKREAHVLASLNHPHIAAIYGLEESNSVQALVLELVEGPTLADRIAEGPMPLDEAVAIARQIAEALEAAHDHGIVHRDLKPANIKLRPDGTVKVLDFGLAKAIEPTEGVISGVTNSPTVTSPALTQMGVILGTAAYMSPEQVKGRAVDKRSDIWAFGAVLYEMLAGQRAFKGDDVPDTLAAVLRQSVDYAAMPRATPRSIRRLVERCLDRDPKRRLRDIGEARILLSDAASIVDEPGDRPFIVMRRPLWRRALPVLLSGVLSAALMGTLAWYVARGPTPPRAVTRFSFPLPDGQSYTGSLSRPVVALSRDGRQIAYTAQNGLFVRSMSDPSFRVVAGTEHFTALTDPVFSADGRWILFYVFEDRTIKKIPVAGGAASTICRANAPYGMSWGPDGILFGQGRGGIMRVSSDGGTPTNVVSVKPDEEAYGPQLLPDGRHVLYTLAKGGAFDRWDNARIVVQALPSGEPTTLVERAFAARYLTTGHLVYATGSVVVGVAFDPRTLTLSGAREPVLNDVMWSGGRTTGASHFTVAENGTLVYVEASPGAVLQGGPLELALWDRAGTIERLKLPPGRYVTPRASPDGKRIAFGLEDGQGASLYTYELSGASPMQRLAVSGNNRYPTWSSDGRRLAFQSDRGGDAAIWQSTLDGSVSRVTTPGPDESHSPESWSPADVLLFISQKGADTSLWTIALPAGKPEAFANVRSGVMINARFRPDGKWVAYTSREGDANRIYVRAYPPTDVAYPLVITGPNVAAHKVSWSPDGKELFYIPRIFELEVVTVTTEPSLSFGNPAKISRPFTPGGPNQRSQYDVTPTGKFLAGVSPLAAVQARTAPRINVVLNWFEELQARVPASR